MRGKGFVIRERVEEQRERVPVKEVESCEGIYSGVLVSLFSSAHGRSPFCGQLWKARSM